MQASDHAEGNGSLINLAMFPFQFSHKISEPQRMKSSCLAALLGSSQDTVLRLLAFPQENPELHSPRLCEKSLLIENRITLSEPLLP